MPNQSLKQLVADLKAEVVRDAQPRAAIVSFVSGVGSDDAVMVNMVSDAAGATEGAGRVPVRYTGPYQLGSGDRVLVSGIGNNLTIMAVTRSGGGNRYPLLRADQLSAPGGTLRLVATGGYALEIDSTGFVVKDSDNNPIGDLLDVGKVLVSADDTTINYLESKLDAGDGIALAVLNDGGNEQLQVSADGLVAGPASSTDNALARHDGTGGDAVQDSAVTVSDAGKLTLADDAAEPPLHITARSAAPTSPATGDIYLDDGTNTASGQPGLRRYDGATWEDISGNLAGPASSTANAIPIYSDASGAVLADSSVTITGAGLRLVLPDDATTPPLSVPFRSTAPSAPSNADMYLDDGSNTLSGLPAWRWRYPGGWVDMGINFLDRSDANVSNPPTDAELDSVFGGPGAVPPGYGVILDDGGADTNVYLITSNGTSWWYSALTKAT